MQSLEMFEIRELYRVSEVIKLDAEHDLSNVELRIVQAQQDLIVNGYNLMRSMGELSVSQFSLEITPPALDLISDPPSRYPYIIPLMVK